MDAPPAVVIERRELFEMIEALTKVIEVCNGRHPRADEDLRRAPPVNPVTVEHERLIALMKATVGSIDVLLATKDADNAARVRRSIQVIDGGAARRTRRRGRLTTVGAQDA
jgi:hypothetical protein